MENRINEQQLDLFADRTSTCTLLANQIRLYFSTFARIPVVRTASFGSVRHRVTKAQCRTIRTRSLKLDAHIRVSVRRIWISFEHGREAKPIKAGRSAVKKTTCR